MKKKIFAVMMIGIMILSMTACSETLETVGKWRVTAVTAGDITMEQSDIEELGLDAGFVKINKSGSCVVNFLGDESEGTWEKADDGSLTFTYGDDGSATATIDNGVMTMVDAQGSSYTLSK